MEHVEPSAIDRTRALYERPPLDAQDEVTFREVKNAVDSRFTESGVRDFLRTLEKAKLRVRDFEAVLAAGKLGSGTPAQYAKLSPSDQGQIRELYLASLERVPMALREKYFKLYAYY